MGLVLGAFAYGVSAAESRTEGFPIGLLGLKGSAVGAFACGVWAGEDRTGAVCRIVALEFVTAVSPQMREGGS